jgi:hypothetical protein
MDKSIEVTPEMIEAGFEVIRKSGIADDYGGADKLLVAEIYQAMHRLAACSALAPDNKSAM